MESKSYVEDYPRNWNNLEVINLEKELDQWKFSEKLGFLIIKTNWPFNTIPLMNLYMFHIGNPAYTYGELVVMLFRSLGIDNGILKQFGR